MIFRVRKLERKDLVGSVSVLDVNLRDGWNLTRQIRISLPV